MLRDPEFIRTGALYLQDSSARPVGLWNIFRPRVRDQDPFITWPGGTTTVHRPVLPLGYSSSTRLWLGSFIGPLSWDIASHSLLTGQPYPTRHVLDSCAYAFNKRRRFANLLVMLKLAEPALRGEVYHRFYGEKETFWLASEMVGDTFPGMMPYFMGVLSSTFSRDACDQIGFVHLNRAKRPWLMNMSLLFSKQQPQKGLRNFTAWYPLPTRFLEADIVSFANQCKALDKRPFPPPARAAMDAHMRMGAQVLERMLTHPHVVGIVSRLAPGGRTTSEPSMVNGTVARNMRASRVMLQRVVREKALVDATWA